MRAPRRLRGERERDIAVLLSVVQAGRNQLYDAAKHFGVGHGALAGHECNGDDATGYKW